MVEEEKVEVGMEGEDIVWVEEEKVRIQRGGQSTWVEEEKVGRKMERIEQFGMRRNRFWVGMEGGG